MLYDEARMALTKERLEDLRKEKKLSFEQLSKQLAERGVNISHTNLKIMKSMILFIICMAAPAA